MPKLVKKREVKQIYLPSTAHLPQEEQAWVTLDVSSASAADILSVDSDDTAGATSVKGLLERIVEWNYTDEEDNPLPVTFENLKLMDLDDFTYLRKQIKGKTEVMPEDLKETSTPTSQPSGTVNIAVQ